MNTDIKQNSYKISEITLQQKTSITISNRQHQFFQQKQEKGEEVPKPMQYNFFPQKQEHKQQLQLQQQPIQIPQKVKLSYQNQIIQVVIQQNQMKEEQKQEEKVRSFKDQPENQIRVTVKGDIQGYISRGNELLLRQDDPLDTIIIHGFDKAITKVCKIAFTLLQSLPLFKSNIISSEEITNKDGSKRIKVKMKITLSRIDIAQQSLELKQFQTQHNFIRVTAKGKIQEYLLRGTKLLLRKQNPLNMVLIRGEGKQIFKVCTIAYTLLQNLPGLYKQHSISNQGSKVIIEILLSKDKINQEISETQIRVTTRGGIQGCISRGAELLLREQNRLNTIRIRGVGEAISKVCTIAFILRQRIPGLHKQHSILSEEVDGKEDQKRTLVIMEIILTRDVQEVDITHIGYQPPLPEDEIQPLSLDEMTKQRQKSQHSQVHKPQRRGHPQQQSQRNRRRNNRKQYNQGKPQSQRQKRHRRNKSNQYQPQNKNQNHQNQHYQQLHNRNYQNQPYQQNPNFSNQQMQQQSLYSCKLCKQGYNVEIQGKNPRILLCGHTYCFDDIKKLFSSGSIKCPDTNCQKTSNYKEVEAIPRNYTIIDLMSDS